MTDSQRLISEYLENGSEPAFRELVVRYVDLVYSVALRMTDGDSHLAEDISQTVFADLSRMARKLSGDVMLGGWLHRHTCFVASTVMRGERRRRAREKEAVDMNVLHENPEADFSHMAPILDAAINELSDADRAAILLRFFEQYEFREIGVVIGSNEDATRMRVTRALDKLAALLKQRGVTLTGGALSIALSANAVQAAPVTLAATISAAVISSGAALSVTTIGATKTFVALTPAIQNVLIAVSVVSVGGLGIYEASRASTFKKQATALEQKQSALTAQLQEFNRQRGEVANALATWQQRNEQLSKDVETISTLRSNLVRLRPDAEALARLKKERAQKDIEEAEARASEGFSFSFVGGIAPAKPGVIPPKPKGLLPVSALVAANTNRLRQLLEQMPEKGIPELKRLDDASWLYAGSRQNLDTEAGEQSAISFLVSSARRSFGYEVRDALRKFIVASDGDLPSSMSQLKPYFEQPADDALLSRYQLVRSGKFADVPQAELERMVLEIAPGIDSKDLQRAEIGLNEVKLVRRTAQQN